MKDFNFEIFKRELNNGDICGLEYLGATIILDLKEKNKNKTILTHEDYIINLFYAVLDLNLCNNIYETTNIENNFKYDLYFETRDLLFKELGFDINKLYC